MSIKIFKLVLLPVLVLTILAVGVQVSTVQALSTKNPHSRMIVKFSPGVDKKAATEKHQGKIISEVPQIGVTVVDIEGSEDEAESKLKQEKIEYVEPDVKVEALDIPSDALYSQQWALPKISWNQLPVTSIVYNPVSPSVEVAVVDTGVDYTHEDLVNKVDTDYDKDFVNNDNDAMDDNLHGTHVAGIIAASTNNSIGVAGTSVNTVKVLPIKVLDQNGSGYNSWVISGITYAADRGVKVINLSLGSSFKSAALEAAVNYAWNKGVVVVAAAGNNNNSSKLYPGAYTNAIAVWASDQNDNKASFSSYGSWVDVGAPGVSILSTIPLTKDTKDGNQDGYYLGSGTSMATPFVAGLAGLLSSQNLSWTNQQIRNKIESTADPAGGKLYSRGNLGHGRINVLRALTQ